MTRDQFEEADLHTARGARRGDPGATQSTARAVLLMVTVAFYAVFGGADFGAGFWDLRRAVRSVERPREVIEHSIGPVWEANHVWLIFLFVVLWTCFPEAYASIIDTVRTLALAALGIVLRGASFAFRKAVTQVARTAHLRGHLCDLLRPGALLLRGRRRRIASGRVPAGGRAGDPGTAG